MHESNDQDHSNEHNSEIAHDSDALGEFGAVPCTAKVILRHDDSKRGEIDYEKEAGDGFDFTHTGRNGEGIAAFATGSRTTPEPWVRECNPRKDSLKTAPPIRIAGFVLKTEQPEDSLVPSSHESFGSSRARGIARCAAHMR